MSRNAFVPMSWITSDLNGEALRTLILISTYADGETGECHPSNALLGKVLGKCDRAIRKAVSEIESAGLISIHHGGGRGRVFRIETPEWYAKPGTKRSANPERNVPSSDIKPGTKRSGFSTPTRNETFQEPGTKRSANPEQNVPGPNKNTVLNNRLNTREEERSVSEESKPTDFAGDCLSALSDLGRKPPPIPAEIKRMATDVNAEAWIGQLQFQEILLDDWRVRETLTRIKARGGSKGVNYAWKIFRDLPEKKPEPQVQVNGHVNGTPRARKPADLVRAEAGLAMARRELAKGETDQAEVDRYEAKVEDLKRKAGIA